MLTKTVYKKCNRKRLNCVYQEGVVTQNVDQSSFQNTTMTQDYCDWTRTVYHLSVQQNIYTD